VNDDRFKISRGPRIRYLRKAFAATWTAAGKALLGRSATGNHFQILENVRGADVFVVQRAMLRWTTICWNWLR